ncbi:MAG: arginine--tRNA ligase [Dehalococcoidia bacterium]|nr:MAG: arginine--tRNA ligase [Dehalococcoidia bacterium]
MPKHKIAELLEQAAKEAQTKELLPAIALPEITLEHPQNPEHGDYASSLPLKMGRAARLEPMAIAEILAGLLPQIEGVEKVSVAAPGFINFFLTSRWLAQQVEEILSAGEDYGNLDLGKGLRVQLEFVSVNPTGPIHVGHGRGAVLGSTLANMLSAAGYTVEKEYYVNDAGSQMDAFYRSLYCRYLQALGKESEMPADGYQGSYPVELAQEIIAETGDAFLTQTPEEAIQELGAIGLDKAIKAIHSDLELLGVSFDTWFSERSLFENSQYEQAMALLRQGGHIEEREGAQWFVSTALGEDKDNVLVRSNGVPTYFASDAAYHYNKFLERGFDRVINIWGADHQGHVSRMKAVIGALGVAPERLGIIISQMVTLRRGENVLRVSKRTGELITLRELVDEVGADACRFFFLSRSADSQMDFDLELAKRESADNPVYYVQYAHARIASIQRFARERNIDCTHGDVAALTTDAELNLIRKMVLFPELIELAARNLEPHHLPYFAQELATAFHSFYKQCRVVSDDEALTWARLKLVNAAQIVLAKALGLMGMTAPEHM